MQFSSTEIRGVTVVDIEPRRDERGFFARIWCADEFAAAGLPSDLVQASLSVSQQAGTLRGMHLQLPPSAEGKLVRCTRGRVFDAVVDLRRDSPSYLRCATFDLAEDNFRAIFVPPGVAHGFMTMVDNSEVSYLMTDRYRPDLATGVRWNDPVFGIHWPGVPRLLSQTDATYPDFDPATFPAIRIY